LKLQIFGAVQGVGFRPFIYRLANSLNLNGWINNSVEGVTIEVEGAPSKLADFLLRIEKEKPPRAFIHSIESIYLDPVGYKFFKIRKSTQTGKQTALVLPDISTCSDCLKEIFDSSDRRYLYPFTNCTNCGPRFTIIEALPYDRPNTSMKKFEMCTQCKAEYKNPGNRRFHAQPNACPVCGPQLALWSKSGQIISTTQGALIETAHEIKRGKILAIKGLGGFHLVVDAKNEKAVQILRRRKHREEKPLALMYPNMDLIKNHVKVSRLEEQLLESPASPIVLLEKQNMNEHQIANAVAPGNPYLGIMLPYTPLHHILMKELNFPIVATSGNLSDEPICIDENEALDRLAEIADLFLVHNRPIVRHVDDSIVRSMLNREIVLRRARGYAPLPVMINTKITPTLAVGAHLKNSIALAVENQIFVSQHIGDLETDLAYMAFENVINSFKKLYQTEPEQVIHDAHPDYLSTKYANELPLPKKPVQHHLAHVMACMLENNIEPPFMGVSWDGTGYGLDGTVWGGEFFLVQKERAERIAHFRSFYLPGGETAIKEPRRSALGLLYTMGKEHLENEFDLATLKSFSPKELSALRLILEKKINSPLTSSVGRLFDAVSSLIGLRQINRFEGQAAMELEFRISNKISRDIYPFEFKKEKLKNELSKAVIDWEPMVHGILDEVKKGESPAFISTKFHNTLAEIILAVSKKFHVKNVVISGGCFQNKYLTESTIKLLIKNDMNPYWQQRFSPNDGGIALGQIAIAMQKNNFFAG
jgi:hydrogenase maturation protein HypF